MGNMANLSDEIEFKQDGVIVRRAHEVVDQCLAFLEQLNATGLMDAIEKGDFADVKRPRDGGKGLDGLQPKGPDYWNPFEAALERELGLN